MYLSYILKDKKLTRDNITADFNANLFVIHDITPFDLTQCVIHRSGSIDLLISK